MTAHSRFGGSSASRWLACSGSVALCESVPPKPSSPYADEGSAAHALAALCLAEDSHPVAYAGQTMEGYPNHPVTEEMIAAVLVYLNAVTQEVAQSKDAIFFVEKGFVLNVETADEGEVFGTNDALVYHPKTGRLRVFDYKHGAGVSVSADDNAQLKFYAAGAVFSHPEWKIRDVVLTIVQPRSRDNETEADAIRDWQFSVVDLLEFMGDVKLGVKRAKAIDAGYATGSHCRWCDAAPVCPAREAEILKAAQLDFADMTQITTDDLPIVSNLDVERLGQILKAGALLNDWLNTVQEYVEGLLMSGKDVPGWKVVEKIGRAKWVASEGDVASYADMIFGISPDQIMPRKLTTIGDAEKLLKAAGATKADIDSFKLKFTLKESSGLTMAPSSDRRPAVGVGVQMFESVNRDSFSTGT